jgi:protein-tyrosine-phosphatase
MLRAARTFTNRLFHPFRRNRARRRLRGIDPRSVLFICHGNVCRSPFAAALFARVSAGWPDGPPQVRSAGFIGPNRAPPAEALVAAQRLGINLESHRSAVFTPDEIKRADLIVVVAPQQARGIRRRFRDSADRVLVLGDLDPESSETRTIIDPWGQPLDVFDASYLRISRCVAELARLLRSSNVK